VSIEKDPFAHRTLELRALYRQFAPGEVPEDYFKYIASPSKDARDRLFASHKDEADRAREEALHLELSEANAATVLDKVRKRLDGAKEWVLIGGPPCQAYSIVGRSRRAKEDREIFNADPRHTLYRYYLDLIRELKPTVFVMENVKGLLSAKIGDMKVFDRIRDDLSCPNGTEEYAVESLVVPSPDGDWRRLSPTDYVIHSEDYGVPQTRHRVILLGSPVGMERRAEQLKPAAQDVSVRDVISDLSPLSGLLSTRGGLPASGARMTALQRTTGLLGDDIPQAIRDRVGGAVGRMAAGAMTTPLGVHVRNPLSTWYGSADAVRPPNHEARSHMAGDLQRYLFCASFAAVKRRSPVLSEFPSALLPAHKNIEQGQKHGHFADRFRVQVANRPAKTVTSHIAKDGHYYIHPDPIQCRSLSVREAARIQTFPDDYFFEGNRTQQYHQVGNAVPPYLAYQIAAVVARLMETEEPDEIRPDFDDA